MSGAKCFIRLTFPPRHQLSNEGDLELVCNQNVVPLLLHAQTLIRADVRLADRTGGTAVGCVGKIESNVKIEESK